MGSSETMPEKLSNKLEETHSIARRKLRGAVRAACRKFWNVHFRWVKIELKLDSYPLGWTAFGLIYK